MKQQNNIKDATQVLTSYWNTYNKQSGYEEYALKTFLDDALYGIGIAINPDEYKWASGFAKFKWDLLKYLEKGYDLEGKS